MARRARDGVRAMARPTDGAPLSGVQEAPVVVVIPRKMVDDLATLGPAMLVMAPCVTYAACCHVCLVPCHACRLIPCHAFGDAEEGLSPCPPHSPSCWSRR